MLNLALVGLFASLFTRRRLLTYHQDRRLWLAWLVFIAPTSLLMRSMSTRSTKIAEIR